MTVFTIPAQVLPAEPDSDYQAIYRLDGRVSRLDVNAASYYEVWLIVKRMHPMASVVAILLVAI